LKIINKIIVELRYDTSPIFFDIQGKIINNFWPNKFLEFTQGPQSVSFKTKDDKTSVGLKISLSNLVYTMENVKQQKTFLTEFYEIYKTFNKLNIQNKINRVGVRSFIVHFGHSFSEVIKKTKERVFREGELLDSLGNSFTVDDFNIVLQNSDITNRIEFGVIEKDTADIHLDQFELLSKKPGDPPRATEDFLFVDTDMANQRRKGIDKINEKVKDLLSQNWTNSKIISDYYKTELKND